MIKKANDLSVLVKNKQRELSKKIDEQIRIKINKGLNSMLEQGIGSIDVPIEYEEVLFINGVVNMLRELNYRTCLIEATTEQEICYSLRISIEHLLK